MVACSPHTVGRTSLSGTSGLAMRNLGTCKSRFVPFTTESAQLRRSSNSVTSSHARENSKQAAPVRDTIEVTHYESHYLYQGVSQGLYE